MTCRHTGRAVVPGVPAAAVDHSSLLNRSVADTGQAPTARTAGTLSVGAAKMTGIPLTSAQGYR